MFNPKKKELFFLFISLVFTTCLNAQTKNSISGRVIDSVSKNGVEYGAITLLTVNDNKVLNGTTTDSLGYFTLSDIEEGSYKLSFESIGYKQKTLPGIHIKKGEAAQNIGIILLSKTDNTLKDVVVTSQKKLIENRIDKLVFNAENDITSQGGVATDILKKIPQVSIDADGNVELAGNGGIRFLINGKPSTAFGSNVADVLQSIPASQIKSIEVITNPGAKYDAQGLGGIINIILKQSTARGINGNLSLTAGSRTENGSFNFNARKGNLGINAFVSGNMRLPVNTPGSSERLST